MVRNANENEFQTFNMAAAAILKKISKFNFDLKWREMQSKMNFEHPSDSHPSE
jgi:hypothetical protein